MNKTKTYCQIVSMRETSLISGMTPISNTSIIHGTKKAGTKVSAFTDNHLVPAVQNCNHYSATYNPIYLLNNLSNLKWIGKKWAAKSLVLQTLLAAHYVRNHTKFYST